MNEVLILLTTEESERLKELLRKQWYSTSRYSDDKKFLKELVDRLEGKKIEE